MSGEFRGEIIGQVPAVRHLTRKTQTATILSGLLLAEAFFVLLVYANSQLLPGDWSGLLTPMLIYVALGTIALMLILFRNPGDPVEQLRADRFLLLLVAFAAGVGIAMSYLFGRLGEPAILGGVAQLQDIVFVGLFVAPIEEMLFRVALPLKWGWLLPAVVLFSVMHLGAYTASGLLYTQVSLAVSIVEVALIGGILWLINRYVGFGAAVGTHMAYDLTVLGAVGGFSVVAVHLQLVPV